MRGFLLAVYLAVVIGIASSVVPNPEQACTWCDVNAICSDGQCLCIDEFSAGNGQFLCYIPDVHDVCMLCDDPTLQNFFGQSVRLQYFGTTKFSDDVFSKDDGSFMRIRVFVTTERRRGKVFPKEIIIIINRFSDSSVNLCTDIFKIEGSFFSSTGILAFDLHRGTINGDGTFSYVYLTTLDTDTANPQPITTNACGCLIQFQISPGFKFEARIPILNWRCGYRPFIPDFPSVKSGVFVGHTAESRLSAISPITNLTGMAVCLDPGNTIQMVQDVLGVSSPVNAMSYLAMTNLVPDTIGLDSTMQGVADALRFCKQVTALESFFYQAGALFGTHPLTRCISGGTEVGDFQSMLDLIEDAAISICEGEPANCIEVREAIQTNCAGLLAVPGKYAMIKALADAACLI